MLHNSRRNPEHVNMMWWRLWIWHIPLDRNMILSRGMLILFSQRNVGRLLSKDKWIQSANSLGSVLLSIQFFQLLCVVCPTPECVVQGSFKVMGSLDTELGLPILQSLLRFPPSRWLWLARLSAGSSAQKDSGLKPTLCCPQDKNCKTWEITSRQSLLPHFTRLQNLPAFVHSPVLFICPESEAGFSWSLLHNGSRNLLKILMGSFLKTRN